METLREELRDSQQVRTELIKWKLLLVSVLAATGLGLTDSPAVPYIQLVLCCIPFVCAYVDLLLYHETIKVHVISEFMRSKASSFADETNKSLSEYEQFSWKLRELSDERGRKFSAFDLEPYVISWASIIFSIAVAAYGILQFAQPISRATIAAGIIGIILTIWVRRSYLSRRRAIRLFFEKSNNSIVKQESNQSNIHVEAN